MVCISLWLDLKLHLDNQYCDGCHLLGKALNLGSQNKARELYPPLSCAALGNQLQLCWAVSSFTRMDSCGRSGAQKRTWIWKHLITSKPQPLYVSMIIIISCSSITCAECLLLRSWTPDLFVSSDMWFETSAGDHSLLWLSSQLSLRSYRSSTFFWNRILQI